MSHREGEVTQPIVGERRATTQPGSFAARRVKTFSHASADQ
ncbi:hypothetical protein [Microbacterium sp. UBA3486]|nr:MULTISPECIES: hypothetical protein [Microbacterium]